ncbi:3-oxoacyl-[acyl-carrier-protein] reductase [Pluralibacter gergoviae]|nr:3-oxoacyl-[acyl-carrier-protein] reductase [Pluralibacter gergoviae]
MQSAFFSNKNVLISGAAGGIGLAISQAFHRLGAHTVMLDSSAEKLQKAASTFSLDRERITEVSLDVRDFARCQEALGRLCQRIGPIDILINNAGISPKHNGQPAHFYQMSPQEWQQVVDVNLHGTFNLSRLVSPDMVSRRFGRIINLSSVAGGAYLPIVAAHYSTTKAAITGFTRHLAGELGKHNITVNALAPGRIETPMVRSVSDEYNNAIIKETPLQRLGKPEEVAEAAIYLASDSASFITGQVLDISGGWLMR